MARWIVLLLIVGLCWAPLPCPAPACSLCPGTLSGQALTQLADRSEIILVGTLMASRLQTSGDLSAIKGSSDLRIDKVLKSAPFLDKKKVLEINRYAPVDDKNPQRFVLFGGVIQDKDKSERFDLYHFIEVKNAGLVEYLDKLLRLDPKKRDQALVFFFHHLDDKDTVVAGDAFLEFARANDKEVGEVAGKLDPDKLRTWLKDAKTPAYRLSLYAFLLGACGGEKDIALFRSLLEEPDATTVDGLLSGLIQLQPKEGWKLAHGFLKDDRKKFTQKYGVLRMVRFYYGWKPEETRDQAVLCLGIALDQGNLADLAIEDLRRWKIWEHTAKVLSLYGKKDYDAPIIQRGILRYALTCPGPEASRLVAAVRKKDPKEVQYLEECLQRDKDIP